MVKYLVSGPGRLQMYAASLDSDADIISRFETEMVFPFKGQEGLSAFTFRSLTQVLALH